MPAKSGEPVIFLDDVWKVYKLGEVEVQALRGVTIKIKDGEFVAITGHSGSGKSTMMNLVGCLDTPTKGRILLEGKDISKMGEAELAHIRGKRIGFVFQSFNLIPSLDALENVMLPMTFQGVPRSERMDRAKKLLESVGLTSRITHKPNELSGGEKQRVAFARALANDPDMILADEPTGNLDSKTGYQIMNLFKSLNKERKKTLVMVTHNMELAKYANRKIVLKDGKVM
ncbi:ABC transporter ATP-binding protein [Candidatus Woesearchaeota archaeon]|nr:ABC transporter ATP-binding protein [Candidatus Woesearchaeota archaeon]